MLAVASRLSLVVGVGLLFFALWSLRPPAVQEGSFSTEPISVPSSDAAPSQPVIDEEYLKDKLFITTQRAGYQSGQMVLKIPRMGVDKGVQSGTSEEMMAQGPSLYEYAQLPGEGNRNVSIVAHRDIEGAEFYFAHKMGPGDLFYLVYNEQIYIYEYETTYTVTPDDWSPIYLQGYSCLTLTTCHPLGSTRQRLIIRAKLTETVPYVKSFSYEPCVEGVTKPKVWKKEAKAWDDTSVDPPAGSSEASSGAEATPGEGASSQGTVPGSSGEALPPPASALPGGSAGN